MQYVPAGNSFSGSTSTSRSTIPKGDPGRDASRAHLLAARALGSSPFWGGERRPLVKQGNRLCRLPRSGPPPRFKDYADLTQRSSPAREDGLHRRLHAHLVGHPLHPRLGNRRDSGLRRRSPGRGRRRAGGVLSGARQALLRAVRPVKKFPSYHRIRRPRTSGLPRATGSRRRDDLATGRRNRVPVAQLVRRTCATSGRTPRARLGAGAGGSPRDLGASTAPTSSGGRSTRTATSSRLCARSRTRPKRLPRLRLRRSQAAVRGRSSAGSLKTTFSSAGAELADLGDPVAAEPLAQVLDERLGSRAPDVHRRSRRPRASVRRAARSALDQWAGTPADRATLYEAWESSCSSAEHEQELHVRKELLDGLLPICRRVADVFLSGPCRVGKRRCGGEDGDDLARLVDGQRRLGDVGDPLRFATSIALRRRRIRRARSSPALRPSSPRPPRARMPTRTHRVALGGVSPCLRVHLRHERAGRVDRPQ